MTLQEFVKLEAKQIRRDKELMQLFVNFYEAAFFNLPKCVGCSFNKAFKKLKKFAERSEKNSIFDKNIKEMTSKTFTVKKQYLSKILTYKKDGVTHRKYGNALTEDFAIALVEHGKTEYFSKLPESEKFIVELNLTDGNSEKYGTKEGLNVSAFIDGVKLSY